MAEKKATWFLGFEHTVDSLGSLGGTIQETTIVGSLQQGYQNLGYQELQGTNHIGFFCHRDDKKGERASGGNIAVMGMIGMGREPQEQTELSCG